MSVPAYPLTWPDGRPRRTSAHRKNGPFNSKRNNGRYIETRDISVATALSRLQDELDRIAAYNPIISSNLETRLDGLPRSGQREPDDPGVALYFKIGDEDHCMPCDTYTTVAQNIAALAAHIEATRRIERHGVATVKEMFKGFQALPAPGQAAKRPWRKVLGIADDANVSAEEINYFFKKAAKRAHPDQGGSDALMAEINQARDAALAEVRAR